MEIADSSETSVTLETTAYHEFNFHSGENLKIQLKTSLMTAGFRAQKSKQESSKQEEKMTTTPRFSITQIQRYFFEMGKTLRSMPFLMIQVFFT
jgi:hypothetical protein